MNSNGADFLRDSMLSTTVFDDAARGAMARAVQLAIADHHRCGFSVAIWRDGRVVMLHPDGSTTPVEEPVQPAQP